MRYPSPSGTLRRMDVSWIDHSWRERAEDGGWLYIREPYLLDGEAFADFAWLEERGWDVKAVACNARHYPGETVAVWITKPRAT